MINLKNYCRFLPFTLIFLFLTNCEAQFLRTDLRTYQLVDPSRQVGVVLSSKGVFFFSKEGSGLANLDLDKIEGSNGAVFISYKNGTVIPESLYIPEKNEALRIRGNFKIDLGGDINLIYLNTIDTSPVLLLVSKRSKHESVLGILGRDIFLNSKKIDFLNSKVLGLDNNFSYKFDSVTSKFTTESGDLVENQGVGYFNEPTHPCQQYENYNDQSNHQIKRSELTLLFKIQADESLLALNAKGKLVKISFDPKTPKTCSYLSF